MSLLPGVKPLCQRELNKVITLMIGGIKPGFVVGKVDLPGHGLNFEVPNHIV
jgi:hypothetical protein